jgi:ribosome assembly protein 1
MQHIAGDNQQALLVRDFNDKIAYAFQLATGQGPLCQEPMQGVAVFLEDLSVQTNGDELDIGRLTGESIRLVREGISAGFLDWSPRIMLAMYSCEIQATSKSFLPSTQHHPISLSTAPSTNPQSSLPKPKS